MTKLYQTNNINEINPLFTKTNNMTSKYKQQDSMEVVEIFQQKGFTIDIDKNVSYAKPRIKSKQGYQKHLMIFDHESLMVDENNKIQLLVTNSHDGTSSLILNLGVYRAICANGLVVGDEFFQIKISHKGQDFKQRVIDGIAEIVQQAPRVAAKVKLFKSIELNDNAISEFCTFAAQERLRNVKGVISTKMETINQPKVYRNEDQKNDLYTVLNRVQESTIRGGISYTKMIKTDDGIEIKDGTTREIKSITEKLSLNRTLWDYAEKLAA